MFFRENYISHSSQFQDPQGLSYGENGDGWICVKKNGFKGGEDMLLWYVVQERKRKCHRYILTKTFM